MRLFTFVRALTALIACVFAATLIAPALTFADTARPTVTVGVGPEYDTTHVYVAPQDLYRLVASLLATFGGKATKQADMTVTPTPSETLQQAVLTPVGLISAFGFKTPVPWPFGSERTGCLVTDMDAAVKAARTDGADIVVTPFKDPIGRDAIIEWPGGVMMQLYWHTITPHYPSLEMTPENRVYLSADKADEFIKDYNSFAQGRVVSDDRQAPGAEIGRPGETYRRVRIDSVFGKVTVVVSDGHLPYPYGRETTGYEVKDLPGTLQKANDSGATVLVGPYTSGDRDSAIVQFPGGYIAEVHAIGKP